MSSDRLKRILISDKSDFNNELHKRDYMIVFKMVNLYVKADLKAIICFVIYVFFLDRIEKLR